MAMQPRNITTTKVAGFGKENPIVTQVATTIEDALKAKHFVNVEALLDGAYRARFIQTAPDVQEMARNGKPRAEIAKFLGEFCMGESVPRAAAGTKGVTVGKIRKGQKLAEDLFGPQVRVLTAEQEKAIAAKSPEDIQSILAGGYITLEQAQKALGGRKFPEPKAKEQPKAEAKSAPTTAGAKK